MRNAVAVLALCLFAIVPAFSQDLSEFDKKAPLSEVKTELYTRDWENGQDGTEQKEFEIVKHYDADGELVYRLDTQGNGEFVTESKYTLERDKEGRVAKRVMKATATMGKGPAQPRADQVWVYTYTDSGIKVVCAEEESKQEEDPDEENPVKELLLSDVWEMDLAGRMLKYTSYLGDKENYRTVFERDKDGKLLTRTDLSGELIHSQDTFTYRDDGTLKESELKILGTKTRLKKHFNSSGKETGGEMVEEGDKISRHWEVERDSKELFSTETEITYKIQDTTYKIYKENTDEMLVRLHYKVTTTLKK